MSIYVIGHKNPDTDAICSALAYADFLRRTTHPDAEAARCGEVSVRTAFALKKAGLAHPKLVLDVQATAGSIAHVETAAATMDDSMLESFEKMRTHGLSYLPVLDEKRCLKGMLSILKIIDLLIPDGNELDQARLVDSSLARICKVIGGTFQHTHEVQREEELILTVGALGEESFIQRLHGFPANKLIVVVGDRPTVQRAAIAYGVRAVVITGESKFSEELLTLAAEKKVSVLLSPSDTATTTLLIKCAKRITHAMDTEFLKFNENENLEQIIRATADVTLSLFPVLREDGCLAGVFSKSDLVDPPRQKLVLVDHNEYNQAVNSADQADIIEVIDHHRLGGGLSSKQPIRFINEPVGSTCTIVAQMFLRAGLTPDASIALALASGIISDTLHLSSPTTTKIDRETLAWLEPLTGLDLKKFKEEFFATGSLLQAATPQEAVRADCKVYEEYGWKIAVAQIEEQSLDDFWKHRDALAEALAEMQKEKSLDFTCLLITDITRHYSVLLVCGKEGISSLIGYPRMDGGLFELDGVVSRKKQLLPHLMGVLAKAKKT